MTASHLGASLWLVLMPSLFKIVDYRLGALLERPLAIGGVESHAVSKRCLHLVRELTFRELDECVEHIVELEVAMVALDRFVD